MHPDEFAKSTERLGGRLFEVINGREADMSNALLALLGVFVGFVLSSGHRWIERALKLTTHWQAIRAEMTLCEEKAKALLTAGVLAPLYRFPVVALHTALPILLAEGDMNEEDVLALSRYTSQLEDLNRGLDYAAALEMDGDNSRLRKQFDRIALKTQALTQMQGTNKSMLEIAKIIVNRKRLAWWQFT